MSNIFYVPLNNLVHTASRKSSWKTDKFQKVTKHYTGSVHKREYANMFT